MTAPAPAPVLAMAVSCPSCGGTLDHVNGTSNGSLSTAVAHCGGCARDYEITARIRRFDSSWSK